MSIGLIVSHAAALLAGICGALIALKIAALIRRHRDAFDDDDYDYHPYGV
ncbi:MAG: hypothetical protein WCZ66_03295 [Sphingomonadaceae bacterium]